jgi:leucyl-tRNA synthetase
LVNTDEPFQKLIHQGTITNNGAKMSKSKGNVVNPDSFIESTGSDVFRMYLMFMGPYELGGDWSDTGIVGTERFVQRAYQLFKSNENIKHKASSKERYLLGELNEIEKSVYRKVNQSVEKYSHEVDNFRFNTAVAVLMELLNELSKNIFECRDDLKTYSLERFASLIAPVAPHFGEECWEVLGNEKSIFEYPVWFTADKDALSVDVVIIAVQVNGKLRATLNLPIDSDDSVVKAAAFNDEKVKSHTDGKSIVKEIHIKNKIYNIVVR